MEELMRFQQLRPLQTLSDEQKSLLGLSLYPKDELTPFAKSLVGAAGKDAYTALIGRFAEASNGKNLISSGVQLHPFIKAMYEWFSFKARPIRIDDLGKFLQTLQTEHDFVLADQWNSIADNLLVAIERSQINVNYCVDFQDLIRICQLIQRCLQFREEVPGLVDGVTAALVNDILTRPIILPRAILKGRCSLDCASTHNMDVLRQPVAIFLPRDGKCECKCDTSCQQSDRHCICIRTYISDLFIVKQELARYDAGELADIENILAGEKKLRHHRTLMHSEDTSQTETESVTSEERDHQVTEKSSLQSEVKNTVDSKLNVDAGVTATFKYGEAITVTPHANVTYNQAKSQAENIARSYAKEIVDRSVTKVQETTRRLTVSKVINEVEETNRHSINNTQAGADHRAGLYFWVNKVSHAQVFNYGRHMMFDLIVPEPAAIWKQLYKLKQKNDNALQVPAKPNTTPGAINAGNYGTLLAQYGISSADEFQPPDETISFQVPFSANVTEPDNGGTTGFSSTEFKSPEIPKGYKANSMDYQIRANAGHPGSTGDKDQVAISVHCGKYQLLNKVLNEFQAEKDGISLPLPIPDWVGQGTVVLNGEQGNLTVALAGFSTLAFALSGSVSITCKLTDEARAKWQDQIYNLIMSDYNRKLDAYNNAQGSTDGLIQIKGRNPFLNREIERNEFKRHVVAILMCNYFNGIGSMMESVAPCGYPEINFSRLEHDAPIIQFFEQVFEWEYMNYVFYHSMWARKCKWPELISEDSGDPLFDKFLTAGAARVQVPIRPGMEEVFHWFLRTGQLWGASGRPPMPGDADYVSMIQELKESLQGDYDDRPGLIAATQGSIVLKLTNSSFYWDLVNDVPQQLNIDGDVDREILVNFKIYRIVQVDQTNPPNDKTSWSITIDRPYADATAANLKHAVGAVFVGAPWEVVIPTELVYLRNPKDKLPVYPLS